jgi:hypothetical protein
LAKYLLTIRRLEGPDLSALDSGMHESDTGWKDAVRRYLERRLEKQRKYYEGEQHQARRRLRMLEPLRAVFGLGSLLVTAVLVAAAAVGFGGKEEPAMAKFLKVALPGCAGVFLSLLAVHEAKRRDDRYGEMIEVLKENSRELNFAPHRQAANETIIDTERSLLGENIEWADTAKYPAV